MNTHLMFASVAALAGTLPLLVFFAIWIVLIIGAWKMFVKSGQPGWACIIPFYNVYCIIKIADKQWWWFLLMLIPLVNIVVAIMLAAAIARKFGKGGGFAAGLFLLPWVFCPILGFGPAQYQRMPEPVIA